jgi:hypothetical protein
MDPLVLFVIVACTGGAGFFLGRLTLMVTIRNSIHADPKKAIQSIRANTHYWDRA